MRMLMLMNQPTEAEVTPTLDSLSLATVVKGTCITHPLQPASVRLSWTATNFNSATQDYAVYRDGILVATQDSSQYTLVLSGQVEDDTHHATSVTFNYRVDIVRSSDSAVLASRSVSVTKSYGDCL